MCGALYYIILHLLTWHHWTVTTVLFLLNMKPWCKKQHSSSWVLIDFACDLLFVKGEASLTLRMSFCYPWRIIKCGNLSINQLLWKTQTVIAPQPMISQRCPWDLLFSNADVDTCSTLNTLTFCGTWGFWYLCCVVLLSCLCACVNLCNWHRHSNTPVCERTLCSVGCSCEGSIIL